jgi:polar amino acid transport system substrate-binding protein
MSEGMIEPVGEQPAGKPGRMKTWQIVVLIVLAALAVLVIAWLLISIFGSGTPAPPPAAALPDYCTRYQTSNTLLVGTSADYPPFEFYGDGFQLTGFDLELIRAVGQKMGKQVEISDMAFDGLGSALQIGQIDAAIAAISVTQERQQQFLFSDVYFVSEAGVLAKGDSPIEEITTPAQLADKRTGVQAQSVYEGWMRDNLVTPGLMPVTNLFTYPRIDHAVEDLRQGRLDVVVLDYNPALDFAAQGGVKLVGTGGSQQLYAIGLNPCAPGLQAEINQALTQLANEGVIASLSQKYFNLSPEDIRPTPTPAPTAAPCVDGMEYLKDLSFDDQDMTNPPMLKPGEAFEKGWRLRNTGTCAWGSNYYLDYTDGNSSASRMGGKPTSIVGRVDPGQTYDMYVDLVAPKDPGIYVGFWSLFNGSNKAFGNRVYVGIEVVPANAATPTPAPGKPKIDSYNVEPASIQVGQCFRLDWSVSGALDTVNLTRNGDGIWNNAPAKGNTEDCPAGEGAYTYALEAKGPGGSAKSERQVQVTSAAQPTATPTPPPPFDGEDYELAEMWNETTGMQPILPDTEVVIKLNPDRTFEGSAGCNDYNGVYTRQADGIEFDIQMVTRKACTEPAGVMEQESAYLALLADVAKFNYEKPSLYFLTPDENDMTKDIVVMEFVKADS